MKINLDQVIVDLKNQPIKDEKEEPVSLKLICYNALVAHYPKEDIDGAEKFKRYKLASKIERGGERDLKAEEITKIKDLLSKLYPPVIYGCAVLMLEKKKLDENSEEIDQL